MNHTGIKILYKNCKGTDLFAFLTLLNTLEVLRVGEQEQESDNLGVWRVGEEAQESDNLEVWRVGDEADSRTCASMETPESFDKVSDLLSDLSSSDELLFSYVTFTLAFC